MVQNIEEFTKHIRENKYTVSLQVDNLISHQDFCSHVAIFSFSSCDVFKLQLY